MNLNITIDAGIKLLHNLSKYNTDELVLDLLEYSNKIGVKDLTEDDVLKYLKEKLNIL